MRTLTLLLFLLSVPLRAAEAPRPYPLWDGKESVAAYAQRVNLLPTKQLDLGKGVTLELVLIPAGQFVMGTPDLCVPDITISSGQVLVAAGVSLAFALLATLVKFRKRGGRFSFSLRWLLAFCLACSVVIWGGTRWHLALKEATRYSSEKAILDKFPEKEPTRLHDNEKPAHSVTLTRPFYIGKYTVTEDQYRAVVGNNPSGFTGVQRPVTNVSWYDATVFCAKLMARFPNKKLDVRLPTEAQWEYSCRAGTQTRFYSGDQDNELDGVGWHLENSGSTIHPVGMREPNMFGLYDMHGNVIQWCLDAYMEQYDKLPATDPFNDKGPFRALRGGSWNHNRWGCRSARRYCSAPDVPGSNVGFRVVVELNF